MKTDDQLQQDIIAALQWEPSIHASQIGVTVKEGVVTLIGHVNNFAEKWHVELTVQRVSGVKALAIEIDVKLPESSKRTDSAIAQAAENILSWVSYIPKDCIKISVENGWITLAGHVEWAYQKDLAVGAIRHLMGVVGLSDNIAIQPKATLKVVKSEVEAALERSAKVDAEKISVTVHDDEIILDGKVHSWSERSLARHSAWCTPGVKSVVDNIVVAA